MHYIANKAPARRPKLKGLNLSAGGFAYRITFNLLLILYPAQQVQ